MSSDKTLELLKLLLDDIKDSTGRINEMEENIHSIEIDLLGQQLISAYGMLQRLKRLGDVEEPQQAAPSQVSYQKYRQIHEQQETEHHQQQYTEPAPAEPEVPQMPLENVQQQKESLKQQGDPQVEDRPEETVVKASEEKLPEPEKPAKQETAESPAEEISEPKPVKEERPTQKAKEEEPEEAKEEKEVTEDTTKKSVHEKLGAGRMSLHERLSQNTKSDNLSSRMGLQPISDLKTAISVNKRIAFVNELFKGDQREFKKAIDFLNKSENFSEAKFYLSSELKHKYNWSEDNDLYRELQHLVRRKFS